MGNEPYSFMTDRIDRGDLVADVQHIMLKNTKQRSDQTEYVHYGAAAEEIVELVMGQIEPVERARDDYRTALKGIATNIDAMLKPVGGQEG